MKKAIYAALALAPLFLLISCGEDEPDPDPDPGPDHQQIINKVNAHLDALGGVFNMDISADMVVSFDFKTANSAVNRALLQTFAPTAPSDGRLTVRTKQTLAQFTAGEAPPLEIGNMKLEVSSETSVAMKIEFFGTVTINEDGIPTGIVPQESVAETFAITYPLTQGGLEIDGVWYAAVEVEE